MPRAKWQLQEAKNQLSVLVRKAQSEGPQVITVHGADAAVVVSAKDYRALSRPAGKLVDFFRKSPLAGVDLKLGRVKDTGRKVEL
jgi:prevent-host-death family protein